MDFHSLPTTSVLSDAITICDHQGIKIIRINHTKATAAISLFGGHLLSFKPKGQEDFLWMSQNADYSGKVALRGGIPVCWPWFGKQASPSHGFARNSIWTLKQHRENENGVIVTLELSDSPETQKIWPHAFRLTLQIEITETLSVQLITTNTDTKPFKIGGALHTYLNLGDIHQAQVTELGETFIEKNEQHSSNGMTNITQEVDRIYTQALPTVQMHDKHFKRNMMIKNQGNTSVVVWNPWSELCQNMADMAADSYLTMLCIESCIHEQNVTLEPNQAHTLSTSIISKAMPSE